MPLTYIGVKRAFDAQRPIWVWRNNAQQLACRVAISGPSVLVSNQSALPNGATCWLETEAEVMLE